MTCTEPQFLYKGCTLLYMGYCFKYYFQIKRYAEKNGSKTIRESAFARLTGRREDNVKLDVEVG